jgi:HSP20 family protein
MWLRVDVYIRESCVVVEAEMPGLERADLQVRATPRTLRIQAPAPSHPREWRAYHRRERARGAREREIPLPAPVDPDAAEARLRDGLLEVCLPLRRPDTGLF